MNQKQQNRLSMHRAALQVLQQQSELWRSLPAFERAVSTLQQSIENRESAAAVQARDTTGTTQDTGSRYREAIDALMAIAAHASAYALEHHNSELYSRTNLSRSYLSRLPANALLAALEQMAAAVEEVQPDLEADYGLTARQVKDARAKIEAARAAQPNTRTQISARAAATDSLEAQEDNARNALQRIDRLITRYREQAPDWVKAYEAARRIVDAGTRTAPPAPPQP